MRSSLRSTVPGVLAGVVVSLAGCAGSQGMQVQPPDNPKTVTLPASEVSLTGDWPAPEDIPPDFDMDLNPSDTDPIYAEGQAAFRQALTAGLEASLRPDPAATGRTAELVLKTARVRGQWDGTYPNDNEPQTERENYGELIADAIIAVADPVRGRRFASLVAVELVIREDGKVVRRKPVRVRSEVNQPVSDRADLKKVLGKLTANSVDGVKERLRHGES